MHDDTIVPEDDRLPFDAERAKAGDPICTSEGKRVIGGLEYYQKWGAYPFRGHLAGYGPACWTETGMYWEDGELHPNDLRTIRQPATHDHQHASDCATNNAPALPPGPCDCASASARYDPALREPFDRARAEAGEPVCDDTGEELKPLYYDDADNTIACMWIEDKGLAWKTPTELRMVPRKTKRWWIISWPTGHAERFARQVMYPSKETAESRVADSGSKSATVSFTDIPE